MIPNTLACQINSETARGNELNIHEQPVYHTRELSLCILESLVIFSSVHVSSLTVHPMRRLA